MAWRVARALDTLLGQFNAKYPTRSKVSDGGIGDAAHASRSSDHDPWYGPGIVTARDFTHDPTHGMDMNRISAELVATRDRRIKYVIWNRRILDSRVNPWVWAPYTGTNPHDHHMHVSVMPDVSCDDTTPWALASFGGAPMPTPPAPAVGMDTATLAAVMGNARGVPYDQYLQPYLDGMRAAGCVTVKRAAMWAAQLGHESGGLQWMNELGTAAYFARYNNRADLGNGPKDGPLFSGHGPIQLTGRRNHGLFSQWCYARGYVLTPTYFVDNPALVAQPRWGFLAAAWYWVAARPTLNTVSDAGDVTAACRLINGGTNGLADRQARYDRALKFGTRLLPTGDDDMTPDQDARLTRIEAVLKMLWEQMAGPGADPFSDAKRFTGWPANTPDKTPRTLVDIGRHSDETLAAIEAKLT